MKSYAEFGDDLYIDYDYARPYGIPDMTMAHMHPGYEVLLVLDPLPYSTVIDGKVFCGKGPMAMLIAPYCMHFTYYTDTNIMDKKYIAFYAGDDFFGAFDDNVIPIRSIIGDSRVRIYNIGGYEDELRSIVDHIIPDFIRAKRVVGKRYKVATVKQKLLFGVLVNIIKGLREDVLTQNIPATKSYISDVITYVVNNLDKKLNMEDIAKQFFVSRDKLNRDFKKYSQMYMKDFIAEARLNLAKSKLQEGKLNIREISEMCGFENDIYFYSFFKKNVGITPREYAKNTLQ